MYNQVTGPSDNPKFAIKITKPKITNTLLVADEESFIQNPMATSIKDIVANKVPACKIILRPSLAKRKLETMPAITL